MTDVLPRRLPRANAPMPGESLAGYILNLAHRLDTSPADLAARTGLKPDSKARWLDRAFALELPDDSAARFAHATGLSAEEVTGLTVASYAGITFDPTLDNRLATTPQGNWWVRLGRSRYCPQCLADTPAWSPEHAIWKTSWLTAWAVACTTHGNLLLDACPDCGMHVGTSRLYKTGEHVSTSLIPNPARLVTHPAACRATSLDKWATACDARLDRAAAPRADRELLDIQGRIDKVIEDDRSPRSVLGIPTPPSQWLRDLRTVITLIQHANPASDTYQGAYSGAAADWVRHKAEDTHPGAKNHAHTQPPEDIPAHAGLLITADHLLSHPSHALYINHLVREGMASDHHGTKRLRARAVMSAGLARAVADPKEGASDPLKNSAYLNRPTITFRPEEVPAYLAEEAFQRHFADVDANLCQRPIRRFIPIALVRLAQPALNPAEAGAFLGYDAGLTDSAIARASDAFDEIGHHQLRHRLARIAEELEEQPRIDYAARRSHFTADWAIPQDIWTTFQFTLRHGRMARADTPWEKRRPAYTAWVWALATHGDANASPTALTEVNGRTCTGGISAVLAEVARRASPAHRHAVAEMAYSVIARIDQ